MSNVSHSNLTSGFIDLATFDELEKYLYGGDSATTYFVRRTRKSTWFTQVPVVLSKSGIANFDNEFHVNISRAGDYLLQTWLRVQLPPVVAQNVDASAAKVRWTTNLMHNLVEWVDVRFNDLQAQRIDSYFLDFWTAFTVPEGKRAGYDRMIGNVEGVGKIAKSETNLVVLNLPLPFFYTRDTGIALPTAALPYNEMTINFKFRSVKELLVLFNNQDAVIGTPTFVSEPRLEKAEVWANYAIVSNDERKRMACAPRDMLIEQTKTANIVPFVQGDGQIFDLHFSHAVKALFFGVRNAKVASDWSNYTTGPTNLAGVGDGVDPIISTSLQYEGTGRLGNMGSDYFSQIQPYYHAERIPETTGYHMYSYALNVCNIDPTGSTNYGKLTNVRISCDSIGDLGTGKFNFVCCNVYNNIIRVSGGALGFPVL